MIKVSIIVPIYNVSEDFLKELIDSLLLQTLVDIEFLFVYDGENETLEKKCNALIHKDKRFVILKKEHSGVSDTRNYGIKHASGEYISFVDSDDFVTPDIYLNAYNLAKDNDSDMVFWDMAKVFPNGKIKVEPYSKKNIDILNENEYDEVLKSFVWKKSFRFAAVSSVCCKMIKRTFLISLGLFFDLRLSIGEDRIFFYSLTKSTRKISYLNECGYFYRQNILSSMRKYNEHGLFYLCEFLNYFDRDFYFKNRSYFGREIFQLMNRSCDLTYMHKENPNSYFNRMKSLMNEIKKDYFFEYIQYVEYINLSFFKRFEVFLLKKRITITLWIRGLIRMI